MSLLKSLSLGRAEIWVVGVNKGCWLPNQRLCAMVWEGLWGCK